jgi:hypothetical protein
MSSKNFLADVADLSERQLLRHFENLVRQDRRHTATLLTAIAAIAEIDERKLWAKQACPSMFAFCVERFHMSESMAGKRIWAARTARRFPVIFHMVARGELHLSAIAKIARHLTEDNYRVVLRRARHKSSREIDVLVAELAPRPDAPSRIRALPCPAGSVVGADGSGVVPSSSAAPTTAGSTPPAPPATASSSPAASTVADHAAAVRDERGEPRPRGRITPLSPRRYKIEITVGQETRDKLRMLEDLLAHQLPSADLTVIVCRAVELLLAETLKNKAAVTDRARAGHRRGDRRTRAIPAAVRREVWQRDQGRCSFADQHGRRCRSTRWIEYHHERPYGKGGQHEAGNIALRCRAHNQYEADLDFGSDLMRDKRHGNRSHSARNV